MKATEVESKWDRNCPSWHSLLGAGWEFGSAHCIISISPNLPAQMETASTCSMSCIIKSFCLSTHDVCCTKYIQTDADTNPNILYLLHVHKIFVSLILQYSHTNVTGRQQWLVLLPSSRRFLAETCTLACTFLRRVCMFSLRPVVLPLGTPTSF